MTLITFEIESRGEEIIYTPLKNPSYMYIKNAILQRISDLIYSRDHKIETINVERSTILDFEEVVGEPPDYFDEPFMIEADPVRTFSQQDVWDELIPFHNEAPGVEELLEIYHHFIYSLIVEKDEDGIIRCSYY